MLIQAKTKLTISEAAHRRWAAHWDAKPIRYSVCYTPKLIWPFITLCSKRGYTDIDYPNGEFVIQVFLTREEAENFINTEACKKAIIKKLKRKTKRQQNKEKNY